jgi:hypothetical protein
MATATSANSFLRTMGGVLGVTVFGSILNNHLSDNLPPEVLPAVHAGYKYIVMLPPAAATQVFNVYVDALKLVFIICVPIAGVALLLSCGIKNQKLKSGTQQGEAPPPVEM